MKNKERIVVEYNGYDISVKIDVDEDGNYDEKKAYNIAEQLYLISEVGLE